MNRIYLILLMFLLSTASQARTLKVAIMDSGLDLKDPRFSGKLCSDGHSDFTGEGIEDKIGHGTHVAGLVRDNAGDSDYCMIIMKIFKSFDHESDAIKRSEKAFTKAFELGVDVINYSGGGYYSSISEFRTIKKLSAKGIRIIASAGNESKDIEKEKYYPAKYPLENITIVGSVDQKGQPSQTSNYGRSVKVWELGEQVKSDIPCPTRASSLRIARYCTQYLSGTSMATAIYTGKLLRRIHYAEKD